MHMASNSRASTVVTCLSVLISTIVGGVFIWSALYKIRWPYVFLGSVYEYEIVGPKFGILVAMALPWIELLVGVCMVGRILTKGAIVVAAAMMGVFVFVHASVLHRGLEIGCGCFSVSEAGHISYVTLLRNGLLLAACLVYLVIDLGIGFTHHNKT